MKMLPV